MLILMRHQTEAITIRDKSSQAIMSLSVPHHSKTLSTLHTVKRYFMNWASPTAWLIRPTLCVFSLETLQAFRNRCVRWDGRVVMHFLFTALNTLSNVRLIPATDMVMVELFQCWKLLSMVNAGKCNSKEEAGRLTAAARMDALY